jgi:hypothetical protein
MRRSHITSNTRTPNSFGIGASHGDACKDGTRVESSLLPEPFHRGAAEGIIFPGALGLDWVVDKLDDIHFGNTTVLIEPLSLPRAQEFWWQQFMQFVDGVSHFMLIAEGVQTNFGPAGVADILVALGNLIEISWQSTLRVEYVDLKGQTATAW